MVRRHRLVEQIEVDGVDAQLAAADVEGAQGALAAVVADPQLGLEEELRAVDAAAGNPFPDLPLV